MSIMAEYNTGVYYNLEINNKGSMCAGKCKIDPGKELVPHSHSPDEIYIITKGTGWMTLGDEQWEVEEGDLIYIPEYTDHSIMGIKDLEFVFVFPKMEWESISYKMK